MTAAAAGAQLFTPNKESEMDQALRQIQIKTNRSTSALDIVIFLNIYDCYRSHLAGPDFDVEVVPLVGDLEDFGPSESVDPQPVSVDEQATCTNSQHDLHALRVLGTTHVRNNI